MLVKEVTLLQVTLYHSGKQILDYSFVPQLFRDTVLKRLKSTLRVRTVVGKLVVYAR